MTPGDPEPAAEVGAVAGRELVDQLRATLDRANELVRVLENNLGEASLQVPPSEPPSELEKRLAAAETDIGELASRLVRSEQQAERLMNLYVATYQLHSVLEPDGVRATIAEIVLNLLGAEKFVLLLRREDGGCEVAHAEGLDPAGDSLYTGGVYQGGDAMVDATLRDGQLRLGPSPSSTALAAVPLRIHAELVGAIVLLRLLGHKANLGPEDRDLLDLLSAHAASALFAARLFAAKDRKLRTLESLMKLARGE